MEKRSFSLPLSDSDRAYLKMHAVRQGKSPNSPDDVLLAIWNGVDPAPVAQASLDAATIERIRQDAINAAVAAVEQHRPVRIEIKQGSTIRVLPNAHRHAVFADVLAALSVRENVYLVGPAGSGKTTIAAQAAESLELPFYSTGAVGMAYQLQGFINAEGKYMETDLYRAYVNGGVFLYPPTKKHPNGKLRLLYEANPMSFLVEQAGGTSMTADGHRTMDLQPRELHERVPLVLGSRDEVAAVGRFVK